MFSHMSVISNLFNVASVLLVQCVELTGVSTWRITGHFRMMKAFIRTSSFTTCK